MELKNTTRTLFTAILVLCTGFAIHSQGILAGMGIAPIHRSTQTDFTPRGFGAEIFSVYQRGPLGIRIGYSLPAKYQKDNFSHTQTSINSSLVYFPYIQPIKPLMPFVHIGVGYWLAKLTTEGYPTITDYELKVEKDSGPGVVAGLGVFLPIRQWRLGLEARFHQNEKAQFLAGGFEPQPLAVSQVQLSFTLAYAFSVGQVEPTIACPDF
jgi:hypothetical protein